MSSEQAVLGSDKVPLTLSLLKTGRTQFPQPLHTGQVLQLPGQSGGPPLDCLQHVHFFLLLGVPDWTQYSDAVCQGPGGGEGPLPWAGCYTHRDTAHAAGLLCCRGTLLLHVQVVGCQDAPILFSELLCRQLASSLWCSLRLLHPRHETSFALAELRERTVQPFFRSCLDHSE